eukprot:PITA_23684
MLKRKSDVFTVFKQFRALVENITGRTIKCLRTDNGGEFTSKEFENYCKEVRIERHITTAYTPQQNEVAECMNRTLLERARNNPDVDIKLKQENVPKFQHIQFETNSNTDDSKYEQVSNEDHEEVPTDNNQQIVKEPKTSLIRSTRIRYRPKRYDDYVTLVALTANDDEPLSYQEVVECSNSDKWKEAMKEEMKALDKNATWDLVTLPNDRKTVGCK